MSSLRSARPGIVAAVALIALATISCGSEPPAENEPPEPSPFLNPPKAQPSDVEPVPVDPEPTDPTPDPDPVEVEPAPPDPIPDPVAPEGTPSPEEAAQKEAADAELARLRATKSRAEGVNAPVFAAALFGAAREQERAGLAAYEAGEFAAAAGSFAAAAEGYQQATQSAVAEAARLADLEIQRNRLDQSRQAFARIRQQALDAGLGNRSPDAADAFADADRATEAVQAGDLDSARQLYDGAARRLQQALVATAADVDAAAREVEGLRAAIGQRVAGAENEINRGRGLESQGRLVEAAEAYRSAAALMEEVLRAAAAGPTPEEIREAVVAVLTRYETALEAQDLEALKRVWPDLAGDQERAIEASFSFARSLDVELQVTSFDNPSEQSAIVGVQRTDTIVTVDGETISNDTTTTFRFRNVDGAWVIEAIGS